MFVQHFIDLPEGKKIFFASDFHLGTPNQAQSAEREQKIVRWLDSIKQEAAMIFLVGDVFDFWFEYQRVIPKGFIRFQGKLAELVDSGIAIMLFTGNHDLWMFGYFTEELGIPVYREPQVFVVNGQTKILVGHGDGLGPGDYTYKRIKKVFTNRVAQWIFRWLHPDVGIFLAALWSKRSRAKNTKVEEKFLGEDEWLLQYCREQERQNPHHFYIFGHRHLPLDIVLGEQSRYINLGEWFHHCTYGCFDGKEMVLTHFETR